MRHTPLQITVLDMASVEDVGQVVEEGVNEERADLDA